MATDVLDKLAWDAIKDIPCNDCAGENDSLCERCKTAWYSIRSIIEEAMRLAREDEQARKLEYRHFYHMEGCQFCKKWADALIEKGKKEGREEVEKCIGVDDSCECHTCLKVYIEDYEKKISSLQKEIAELTVVKDKWRETAGLNWTSYLELEKQNAELREVLKKITKIETHQHGAYIAIETAKKALGTTHIYCKCGHDERSHEYDCCDVESCPCQEYKPKGVLSASEASQETKKSEEGFGGKVDAALLCMREGGQGRGRCV